jgi:hypothetical protein
LVLRIKSIALHFHVFSGCTSLAVVDLKADEAKEAANELTAYARGKHYNSIIQAFLTNS